MDEEGLISPILLLQLVFFILLLVLGKNFHFMINSKKKMNSPSFKTREKGFQEEFKINRKHLPLGNENIAHIKIMECKTFKFKLLNSSQVLEVW